jgi:hypothetical protein
MFKRLLPRALQSDIGTAFHTDDALQLHHVLAQLRLARQHFRWRIPIGPFPFMNSRTPRPVRLSHGGAFYSAGSEALPRSRCLVTHSTDVLRSLMHVYGAEGDEQEILENEGPTGRLRDVSVVQQAWRRDVGGFDLGDRVSGSDNFVFGHAKFRSTNARSDKSDPTFGPATRPV